MSQNTNAGWPVLEYPAPYMHYLDYDWYSGLWEFSPEATVRFGHEADGFGTWTHAFLLPAAVE